MINKTQITELITDTLKEVVSVNLLVDERPVKLLLGTMAQESAFGTYIKQIKGPALGVFQMEPPTFQDILDNYLAFNYRLKAEVIKIANVADFKADDLWSNLKLSILFARLHYYRVPKPLPKTIEDMAWYWKTFYNSYKGAGSVGEFVHNYKKYVE